MKEPAIIAMMAALLPAAALAQLTWTGNASSVYDASGNWSPRAPNELEATADIRIQPVSDGVERLNYPVLTRPRIINGAWGVSVAPVSSSPRPAARLNG